MTSRGRGPLVSGGLSPIASVAPGTVATATLDVETCGRGFTEITREASRFIALAGAQDGMLTIFIRHTSASLLIQENADPDVQRDLEAFFARLVPDGDRLYIHTAEGDDDMPAHVRTALTAVNLSIPVTGGAPALGTWQGIYLWEHRTRPHTRRITAHLIGE